MASGGYRTPTNPAPVSGPGALSRRTDGQAVRPVTGLPYGENQDLNTQQAAAPMAGTTAGQPVPPLVALPSMTPDLYAPSDRPDEPVTAGASVGPGGGPEILGPPRMPAGPTQQRLAGLMPVLARAAEQPYASDELRAVVSYLRSVQSAR